MHKNNDYSPPETIENLLKKLSSLISNNNKDISDKVYCKMRESVRQHPPVKLSKGYSNYDDCQRNQDFEEFVANRGRIKQYLESTDPAVAQAFTSLVDRVQHDKSLILAERMSSLNFLMATSRRTSEPDMLVLQQKLLVGNPKDVVTTQVPIIKSSTSNNITKVPCTNSVPVKSQLKCSRSSECMSNPMDIGGGLSEWDIMEGITFAWQGISSRIFQKCLKTNEYILIEKWDVTPWVREQANNLARLGKLHDILKFHSKDYSNDGLVRKSLIGFIRDQLSAYYSLIASIRTEFQHEVESVQNGTDPRDCKLSFPELRLLTSAAEINFQNLISIVKFTENDSGGFLTSGVFSFLQSGDKEFQRLVKNILSEICRPIYDMLAKWLLEGELCDPKNEFFIAVNGNVVSDRLWHEKYSLRLKMLPQFIPVPMAEKILSVGRSINFLRESCGDEKPYADRDKMKDLLQSTLVEVMYLMEREEELEGLIDKAYQETNRRVLSVLIDKYRMLDHFQAHRKYLLLGQGDFINYLMELLLEILDGPGDKLHPHLLNGLLENAIRATSAQNDAEDIVNRLDAHTLAQTCNDTGWDVFYLRYHVDGPIGTVFHGPTRAQYRTLFFALWKAKRMEVVLSKSWMKQLVAAKMFRSLPELSSLLRQCNELTQEMTHFVRQTQYYFLFEVLECSWNQLIEDIHQSECLDNVIASHQQFLQNVSIGVFKHESRDMLSSKLRMVYEFVLQLKENIDILVRDASKELQARIGSNSGREISDKENARRKLEFIKSVHNAEAKIKLLAVTYRDTIKQFLLILHKEHDDPYLQLLSVRLDFNEYYKNLDSRLGAPLTFQHRRLSTGGELSPGFPRASSSSPHLNRKKQTRC